MTESIEPSADIYKGLFDPANAYWAVQIPNVVSSTNIFPEINLSSKLTDVEVQV